MNQICRPYISDKGAQNNGPMANPRTNKETPSIVCSSEASKASIICGIPPEYAEELNATASVATPSSTVIHHFLDEPKVCMY